MNNLIKKKSQLLISDGYGYGFEEAIIKINLGKN